MWAGITSWEAALSAAAAGVLGWMGKRQARPGSFLRRRLALERTLAICEQTVADLEARLERRNASDRYRDEDLRRAYEEVARLEAALERVVEVTGLLRDQVTAAGGTPSSPAPTGSRPSSKASSGSSRRGRDPS